MVWQCGPPRRGPVNSGLAHRVEMAVSFCYGLLLSSGVSHQRCPYLLSRNCLAERRFYEVVYVLQQTKNTVKYVVLVV